MLLTVDECLASCGIRVENRVVSVRMSSSVILLLKDVCPASAGLVIAPTGRGMRIHHSSVGLPDESCIISLPFSPCGPPRTIVVGAEAEGCDRVAVEARDFQVEDGGGRDEAGVDMGDQGRAREARDPFAGTKIGEGCPGLAVERPEGMLGRAHKWRGRALVGDRGEPMGKGAEASGDTDIGGSTSPFTFERSSVRPPNGVISTPQSHTS